MAKTIAVKISNIAIDGDTQQREQINDDTVEEYAEAMKCGAKFPAVSLFFDGVQHWLADGFHRYHASRSAEIPDILAEVREGTKRDARLFSAGANGTHGMRLSNSDKRRSVLVLLRDKEWSCWSDNQIAKHCHVTHPFVGKVRKEIAPAPLVTVTTAASKPNEHAIVENGKDAEKPAKPAEKEEAEPEYNPGDYALEEARDAINHLQSENEALRDAIATSTLPTTEIQSTSETIKSLRSQVKTLEVTLAAITSQRDILMMEKSELMSQCAVQRKQMKRLKHA
jgi:vacuolar-type H+-ATPase subunit I/STV1